jgi:hypothetical protein
MWGVDSNCWGVLCAWAETNRNRRVFVIVPWRKTTIVWGIVVVVVVVVVVVGLWWVVVVVVVGFMHIVTVCVCLANVVQSFFL